MKGGKLQTEHKNEKISSDDIFASEKQKRSSQNRIWHKIASMLIFALQFAIKIWPFQYFLLGRRLLSRVSFPEEISALLLVHPLPKRSQQQHHTWFLSWLNSMVPWYHAITWTQRKRSLFFAPQDNSPDKEHRSLVQSLHQNTARHNCLISQVRVGHIFFWTVCLRISEKT